MKAPDLGLYSVANAAGEAQTVRRVTTTVERMEVRNLLPLIFPPSLLAGGREGNSTIAGKCTPLCSNGVLYFGRLLLSAGRRDNNSGKASFGSFLGEADRRRYRRNPRRG